MAKVIGYMRISTSKQDLDSQKLEILDYARKNDLIIDHFIQIEASTRKTPKARLIDELMSQLETSDTLIVAELSRLGRSVGQVASMVDDLISRKIKLIAIKEGINLNGNGKKDIQTTVMTTMFSLFAEIERQLISERTKAGLAAARARGALLGRPKGSTGESILDGKEDMIKQELKFKVSKSAIARKLGCSWACLDNFIKSRGLKK